MEGRREEKAGVVDREGVRMGLGRGVEEPQAGS